MDNTEQSESRPERRIALIPPSLASEHKTRQAMRTLDSLFWALRETVQSSWIVTQPETADVVVVSHVEERHRTEQWAPTGKVIVVLVPDVDVDVSSAHVLVFPFRTAEVVSLLERLERQLKGASSDPEEAPAAPASSPTDQNLNLWAFVETLRTLKEVQNGDAWIVGRDGDKALLWIKSDGSSYAAEPSIVHAMRRGAIDLSWLRVQRGFLPVDSPAMRPGAELAWFAGFHASPKTAPWLNPEKRFKLAQWPDFETIRPTPAQRRVVEILAEIPSDCEELAACAHVSLEDARRTVNALSVCDALVLPEPQKRWVVISQRITLMVTNALSAILRTSAEFLDTRASLLASKKRSS